MAQQVSAILDELAKRFGATAEHLWAVVVRQQVVEGVLYAFFGLLGTVVVTALIVWAVKVARREWTDDDAMSIGLMAMMGMFPLTALAGTIALLISGILRITAPEYYALQAILRAVAGK